MTSAATLVYCRDIDGLRALAVLAVILYHAFPTALRGGFVGVDVFFVISGYLITLVLHQALERGDFSLLDFYARRIRRIFPALLLMLLACLVFGWFGLHDDEYAQLGKHVLGGVGFVANLVLWNESGYFDNSANTKPLLHLWSLGIEEQFYLVWPWLLAWTWRRGKSLLGMTLGLVTLSLAFNLYVASQDQVADFYSPLTRFWELSVGSGLALLAMHGGLRFERHSALFRFGLSAAGWSLLMAAVVLIHEGRSFPGVWALLPVLGAAALIAAGPATLLNRWLLSNRLAVGLGLISYPLYLWHWPLLALGVVVEGQMPDRRFRLTAVLVSVVLAWFTYRYVERPIRRRPARRVMPTLLLGAVLLGLAGGVVMSSHGLPERAAVRESGLTPMVRHEFMGSLWPYTRNPSCLSDFSYPDAEHLAWWFCMKSDDRPPTLILLGTSHANSHYPGFVGNPGLRHHTVLSIGTCDFAVMQANFTGDPHNPCYGDRAKKQQEFIDNVIAGNPSIRFAVIDGLSSHPNAAYIHALDQRIKTLEQRGIRVVVMVPHIMPGFHPKACYPTPFKPQPRDCRFSPSVREAQVAAFQPAMDELSSTHPELRFFDQNIVFCESGECSYLKEGLPLYRDSYSHLSEYASLQLQTPFTVWAREQVPELFDAAFVGR